MSRAREEALTVMVVDDNPSMRELIEAQLRGHGYEVVTASDGREAVRLARLRCPSLVLMDIHLPVMDGLEATRLIRRVRELCRMPIVAFSAYGEEGDSRRRALDAGCTEYVSKTVGITLIPAVVDQYLRAQT